MFWIYAFFSLILWTIFGSLWSVLLERLEDKHDRKTIKSILIGRSQCPKCKHTLGRRELVPLGSYFAQKGKCKHCGAHISPEYPILEIGSAAIFVITYLSVYYTQTDLLVLNNISTLIFWIGTNWLLMLLIIHDFKTFELHMPIRWIAMTRIWGRQIIGNLGNYWEAILSTIVATLIFVGIYIFGKRYVRKRFKSEVGGFWEWDIYVGAILGGLFPFIWNIHNIQIDWITSIEIWIVLVMIASIIGLLYAGIRSMIEKTPKKIKKINDLFSEWINTNKVIPFIPSLILAFRILLYKAEFILHFVF